MPKITNITNQWNSPDRVSVFIDGAFCTGIRKRTFQGMNLKVGDEITCGDLKEKESFFWKQSYGEEAWKKEKVRINKVKDLIESIDTRLVVKVTGFGADSIKMMEEHSTEKGSPDLEVSTIDKRGALIKVEVTGTERLRGAGYWVRPDKLEFAENHPNEDVWIVLHYAEPKELFVFIKPVAGRKYERHAIKIRSAGEIMCVFNEGDAELHSQATFCHHVRQVFDFT
jgi:hypothetical protein